MAKVQELKRSECKIKSKKILLRIICGIYFAIVIIAGGIIWWNAPCSIIKIPPSKVSKIDIFDGNTGKAITITDATDIKHIIENLNTVSLRKYKISLGYMGFSLRTTIYNVNGDIDKEFIVNSSSLIRKDPFFYLDSSNSIDYSFILKLAIEEGQKVTQDHF